METPKPTRIELNEATQTGAPVEPKAETGRTGAGGNSTAFEAFRAEALAALNISVAARDRLLSLSEKYFKIVVFIYGSGDSGKCRSCLELEVGPLGDNGSGPIRDVRNLGYEIPRTPKRGKGLCQVHADRIVTIDFLKTLEPNLDEHRERAKYTPKQRKQLLKALGELDNFELRKDARLEIDHRIPMARRTGPETPVDTSDLEAVRQTYQLLSSKNNAEKRMRCIECVNTGKRPVFLGGIRYWPTGNQSYDPEVGCSGCPWAYPEQYREGLQRIVDSAPHCSDCGLKRE